MSPFYRRALVVLVLLNAFLVLLKANANLSKVYYAKGYEDGAAERAERIAVDMALAARIDELHNLLAERDGL